MEIVREGVKENIREAIIKDLYDIATVKWSPSKEFHEVTKKVLNNKRKPYSYYKVGEVYYGMPFTKGQKVDLDFFMRSVKDGVLNVPFNYTAVSGADCTSSMIFPMLKYTYISPRYLTNDFIWDRSITYPLGNIKLDGKIVDSDVLTECFSKEEFFAAYSMLKIGDVVSSHYEKEKDDYVDHTRIMSGSAHVEKDENGMIDGDKSYVIVIENTAMLSDTTDSNNYGGQINENDYVVPFTPNEALTDLKSLNDLKGKHTHFKINRKITFASLFANHYIPLSFYFYNGV